MTQYLLSHLLGGIKKLSATEDMMITGLCLDSRRLEPGEAFVALCGGTSHGIEFAAQAVARGARTILAETPLPTTLSTITVPLIEIKQLRAHLGVIADRFYRGNATSPYVIGVTGTNGKTSTVQLLAQALHAAGNKAGSIGTLGFGLYGTLATTSHTTPDVLCTHAAIAGMGGQGATHIVMEVSSHALDQGRVDGLQFVVAVFTNLTRDHLDYHHTMAAYAAAKSKLFVWPQLQTAVINIDDAFGVELAAQTKAQQVITCSAEGNTKATLYATDVHTSSRGTKFQLIHADTACTVSSPLLGRFNVANLISVAGVLLAMGWSFDKICSCLTNLQPVYGRMNRLGGDGRMPLLVVDYAHTPDALDKALQALREHTSGRLFCVFGCGGNRDRGKRAEMGAIAEHRADVIVLTDDNPRDEDGNAIIAEIQTGLQTTTNVYVLRDRRAAIHKAVAMAAANDTVLIAGKGHEPYQEVLGVQHPFDDLAEARAALEAAA